MKGKFWYFICLLLAILLVPMLSFGGTPGKTNDRQNAIDQVKNHSFTIYDEEKKEVFSVSERDYVIGAVAAEMPASFHPEALKAQAVAVHTYAIRQCLTSDDEQKQSRMGADLSANPAKHQGYLSKEQAMEYYGEHFEEYYQKISDAVDAVFGEILTYDDEPILAAYHAFSGGTTEYAKNVWGTDLPYLIPVSSISDTKLSDYRSSVSITETEMKELLQKKYKDIQLGEQAKDWLKVISRSDSETVLKLKAGDQEMTGQEARSLFGLRSADFTTAYNDGIFQFTVKGYGHGVGLSQQGANYMAENGDSYRDILLHYYQGVTISNLTDFLDEN